ncbi:MAG: hypothetical protein CVU39_02810 [Chloroflexi bacterium HGW-Chloroflexi-10]|nr:MAG: hypothetical protein CVU39_02810 [Chloroflexi bacterium HGW-Chloroflexi-10]
MLLRTKIINHIDNKLFKRDLVQFPLLLIVISLPFILEIISGNYLYWGTISLQFVPWLRTAVESIVQGTIPLWNNANGFGAPLMANYQSAIFYPINWVLIPLHLIDSVYGIPLGISLLVPLHLVIGAWGMAKFMKGIGRKADSQVLAGLIWGLGGFILGRINFPSMVYAYSWLPWVFCFISQSTAEDGRLELRINRKLILSLTFLLLSGHAQFAFYGIVIAFIGIIILFAGSKFRLINHLLEFFLAGLFAVGISAIQLIPTAEYLLNSQRANAVSVELALNFSFWPLRILTVFFGDFFGNPNYNRFVAGGNYWEDLLYIGVIPFIFVIFGIVFLFSNDSKKDVITRKIGFFSLLLMLFSFTLAIGKNSPVFPFLYEHVPTFDMFQAPSRFLLLATFSFCIFAVIGLDYWITNSFSSRRTGKFIVGTISLLIVGIVGDSFFGDLPTALFFSIVYTSVMMLLFLILTLLKDMYKVNNRIYWITPIFIFTIIDLVFMNFQTGLFINKKYYATISSDKSVDFQNELIYIPPNDEEFVKFKKYFRFDRFQSVEEIGQTPIMLLPNANLFYENIHLLNNFDPFIPDRFDAFQSWLGKLSESDQNKVLESVGVSRKLQLDVNSPGGYKSVDFLGREIVQWYDCAVVLPADEILNVFIYNDLHMNNNQCVMVEAGDNETGGISKNRQDIKYLNWRWIASDQLQIKYESENQGWILIRKTWYPGWKALLEDQTELPLIRGDFLFSVVNVPAGTHELVLVYHPPSFLIGSIISLFFFLALLIKPFILMFRK